MNRRAYVKGWKAIRKRILERANYRCEHCGVWDGSEGYRDARGIFHEDKDEYQKRDFAGRTKTKISLQIAHLDHNTLRNDDSNLAALCQRCHLRYDTKHHQTNRAETLRNKKAIGDLPGLELT